MKITEIGQYELLKDISVRNSIAIAMLKKGSILNITQIDIRGHKVISKELMDWTDQCLPVRKIAVNKEK